MMMMILWHDGRAWNLNRNNQTNSTFTTSPRFPYYDPLNGLLFQMRTFMKPALTLVVSAKFLGFTANMGWGSVFTWVTFFYKEDGGVGLTI